MSENEYVKEAAMSVSISKLAKALSAAQGEMEGAKKGCENPFFKRKYADLWEVWQACREPLAKNGLAVVQTTEECQSGDILMITTLMHESGEWTRGRLKMKPVKQDPQGYGSCITYARRYALAAIVGVSPEDDDGNTASSGDKKAETPKTAPKKPAASPKSTVITKQQGQDIFLKATANKWATSAVKDHMKDICGVEKSAEIKPADYTKLMAAMESEPMISKRQLARVNILLNKVCPGERQDQHNMVGDALQIEPPKSLNDLTWAQAEKANEVLFQLELQMAQAPVPTEETTQEAF